MLWRHLIHLGDLPLTMAAAAAATVWMLVARLWKLAFWWSFLFASAISSVATTKVAFLAWGTSSPAYDFHTLSGHATGVTALSVMLTYLVLSKRSTYWRMGGIAIGLMFGGLMVVLLVAYNEHSLAEAVAGWGVGAVAAIGAIHFAASVPVSHPPQAVIWAGFVFMATAVLLRQLPLGYLMWRVAKLIA